MTTITDNFNRSNNLLIDSPPPQGWNWESPLTPTAGLQIVSNVCQGTGNGHNTDYSDADIGSADYYVQAIFNGGTQTYCGVHARENSSGNTFYEFRRDPDGSINLYRSVGGSETLLRTGSASAPSNSLYRIEVSGTGATVHIVCKINGTEVLTAYDDTDGSRITAQGFAALRMYETNYPSSFSTAEDFEAGPLGGGGGGKPTIYYNQLRQQAA